MSCSYDTIRKCINYIQKKWNEGKKSLIPNIECFYQNKYEHETTKVRCFVS